MKKYTNKILLIAAIAVALFVIIGLTVDFQIQYHKNPESMRANQNIESIKIIKVDSAVVIDVEDSIDKH